MDKSNKIVAVTGATGQQGSAVTRHLLANGWQVRALTREPSKPAAQTLKEAGAQIAQADNEDRATLDAAFKGVYGVFSVQNFWLPGVGVEGEIRQGKLIADAAKAANVEHFVYTSVGGAERNTLIPHFESKWQIEEYIRSLGLPATILRPVAFMDNYNWNRAAILGGTFFSFGLHPDTMWQTIAVDDIGAFTALAFEKPGEFIGRAIEIAGDELTETQTAATFSKVIGRPVQVAPMPVDPNQPPDPELMKMTKWANEEGYQADIPELRRLYPPLKTLETWLRQTGWENAQPIPETESTSQWNSR